MNDPFLMLGIESSCDETAAALVTSEGAILASEIASQMEVHASHGGVVPEIAARAHLDAIDVVIGRAMETAGVAMGDLDGVAATGGPGLIGGVVVGTVAAKAIATARGIPYYAVNHLEGHALSPRLVDRVGFPYLLLLVSGGHTQILAVHGPGVYERYGTTMDDAAGEAFDKSAKIMGLGYPGGPAIERAAADGNAALVHLPRPLRGADHCHFSFSGLKTAVATRFAAIEAGGGEAGISDLAAALQAAIADCLADRAKRAMARFAETHGPATLVIAGGVAANRAIFARLETEAGKAGFALSVPPAWLCTDNAAMIAWAALERRDRPDELDFAPRPRWPLDPEAP
ncbi:MAG: tRNA (adenosine(37)-N6)-threonylcarbamoyltransferase complex transferase subunit TsaD, partial [Pseudomonadota bacterium]|nr:tRNA (adenosine(37)-N6)-threonylcarbamoyltransferase complex transferase subunit TsaD [Pseudomonadota bacterium]